MMGFLEIKAFTTFEEKSSGLISLRNPLCALANGVLRNPAITGVVTTTGNYWCL